MKKVKRFLASILALTGLGLVGYTTLPIIIFDAQSTVAIDYLSPLPEDSYLEPDADSVAIDYTKASNWFDGDRDSFSDSKIKYYSITIPYLGIEDATVNIGGEDLSDYLIQYPGTALPGKIGNAVVFGHSILPQFYDPKDYLAIFSTLPTIKKGEEIIVRYDGITYRYVVEDKFEVLPTDLEILSQNKTDSYITLVTCTPPGHPLRPKRLIVRAKLVPYNS